MNEKVEGPQEQPSDRAPMPDEELQKILEEHRKWVESEGKEGERANLWRANLREADLSGANLREADLQGTNLQGAKLYEANLQEANLNGANLREADLSGAKGLIASEVKKARNWKLAFYSEDFLKKLRLPPDHNEKVKKKLAEMEKEKKATGEKP